MEENNDSFQDEGDGESSIAIDETNHQDSLLQKKRIQSPSSQSNYFSCLASSSSSQIYAILSNFSTSYNVINVSYILPMTFVEYPLLNSTEEEYYDTFCKSSLLLGMILGQLIGGALGDVIGRQRALLFMVMIQVVSSVGSSLCIAVFENNSFFVLLGIWRLVLGVGAGAIYPLAAVLSAESNVEKEENERKKWRRMACTFSTQGFAFWATPLLTWSLLGTLGEGDVCWRVLLGVGALPGLLLLSLKACQEIPYHLLRNNENPEPLIIEEFQVNSISTVVKTTDCTSNSSSLYEALKNEPNICRKLLGTAFIWFLFDVLFYGNTLFQPIVLKAAFGQKEDMQLIAWDAFVLASISLPGYIISVYLIGSNDWNTPKIIQQRGFGFMSLLYIIIGIGWSIWDDYAFALIVLYGLSFFFCNYGPNMTTFILPSITYSQRCRSTLNGIAAAAGKFGAFLGTLLFQPIANTYGDDVVMYLCASLAIVGLATTKLCVVISPGNSTRNDDNPCS